MKTIPVKKTWLELAESVYRYHIGQQIANDKWRVEDSARELKRSFGCISQYVLIGRWLKTHENQLSRCDSMNEALAWIKKNRRELLKKELDD